MIKFLKWLILEVWTPINIRIGIVYGFIAQFKFLAEIVILGSGLFFLLFRFLPSRKMLALAFVIIIIISVGLGEFLIRWKIPQKMNEKANKINPQINALDEILENTREILKK